MSVLMSLSDLLQEDEDNVTKTCYANQKALSKEEEVANILV